MKLRAGTSRFARTARVTLTASRFALTAGPAFITSRFVRTVRAGLTISRFAATAGVALIASPPVFAAPADLVDEVFYQFMPIAWRDSDNDTYRFGDFAGMEASLSYLDTLGITAIWMNPIFPSPAYHGYQHGEADALNPWFGAESDLTSFVEAAHARGIKVFVDLVAYGISHDTPYFQSAFGDPSSPYDSWLAFTNAQNTQYLGALYQTWNGDDVGFIHWDLRDPGPVGRVTDWGRYWLDPNGDQNFTDGLDGYRLDHVWENYPSGPDGWGYNLDTFWAPWRESLRAVNPDVVIFAEQADWGSHGEELFPGMDATFTKPFEFAARNALQNEWAAPLYGEMASTVAAQKSAPVAGTFLGTISNHDVDRLASAIGDDPEKGKAAAAVLLTQPYAPVIYYGDEIGMRGTKNTGYPGDAADIPMREPFKWNAVAGAPMSNYFLLSAPAYAGRISQNNDGRSVEEQLDVNGSLLEAYRELIAARRANVALRRGNYAEVGSSSSQVWAFVRDHAEQQVLVAINLSSSGQTMTLDLSGFLIPGGSTVPEDLLTGNLLPELNDANKSSYPLVLDPYGYVLLEVEVVPPTSLVDGRNIPANFGPGALRASQNNATGLGDNVSELNQLFLTAVNDSLRAGLTGNLATDGTGLALLFDTRVGGQNVLDFSGFEPPPSGPGQLTGTRLDVGFEPDYILFVNAFGGTAYVDQFEFLSGGGIGRSYRGSSTVDSGEGFLSGGQNSSGMQLALDNTNTAGVTDTGAADPASATTGFEMYLPFADLALTGDSEEIRVAAFLLTTSGVVSNQWLPGVGGGLPNLGVAPDMTQIPGDQFIILSLDPDTSSAPESEAIRLDLRTPIVSAVSAQVSFTFTLPTAGRARLGLFDVQGRSVQTLFDEIGTAGEQALSWDLTLRDGQRVPTGVYFARLQWRGQVDVERLVLLR